MADWLKRVVLRLARVPPDPHVPEGLPESIQVFHPGRNYFRWCILVWLAGHAMTLIVLLSFAAAGLLIPTLPPVVRSIWLGLGLLALLGQAALLPLSYFAQRLNYEMRWYIVTDRSLRIRSGILRVQEITMTFANIQEIRVTSNPIEKLLGLANVEVWSAGGSRRGAHGSATGHLGKFEGLSNADTIRDLMMDRLRKYRDSGLGEHKSAAEQSSGSVEEARAVLEEVRALRAALGRR